MFFNCFSLISSWLLVVTSFRDLVYLLLLFFLIFGYSFVTTPYTLTDRRTTTALHHLLIHLLSVTFMSAPTTTDNPKWESTWPNNVSSSQQQHSQSLCSPSQMPARNCGPFNLKITNETLLILFKMYFLFVLLSLLFHSHSSIFFSLVWWE